MRRTRRSWTRRSEGARWSALFLLLFLISLMAPITSVSCETASRGDGNDTFATAGMIESGKQTPVSYLGVADDPVDFYYTDLQKGQVVEAYLIILQNDTPGYGYNFSNPSEVDFDLDIFGPLDHDGPLTSSRTKDQFEVESIVAAVAGKYHFKLSAVNNSGDYVFMVTVSDPPILEDGAVHSGYIKQNSDHDADWYKVKLDGGNPAQAVTVSMTHDGTGNLDLFLMDLWCKGRPYYVDVSWFGDNKEEVRGVASYSGYYYLKVHAFWGYGNYQIKVDIEEAPTDNDNERATAHLLEYNTTWSDRVDQSRDKYDYFELRLQPQETVSIDLVLLNGHEHIYSVFLLEVDLDVISEKTNYIFEPQHATGPDIEFSDTVDGGVYYVAVMAKVALKNPDDLSDENAAADYSLTINMSKHPERPPNKAPQVKAGMEDMSIEMEEDTVKYLDLDDVFLDPEGDKLVYGASLVGGGDVLSVSADMSGTVTIVPKLDWFGTARLNLTAEDPEGERAWLVVNVTVANRPEPPIVVDYGPGRTTNVAEGESREFFVVVEDKDSFVIDYVWKVDGVDQDRPFDNFTYAPGYADAGPHTVLVRISDRDTVVEWDWDVTVNDINRAPRILSMEPINDSVVRKGKKVNLVAVIDDPDGDVLSFELREGADLIGKGAGIQPNINHTFVPGKHTVRLVVSDNKGATVTRDAVFRVKATDDGGIDIAVLATGAMVALVVAFLIFAYVPRGAADDKEVERAMDEERRGRAGKRKKGGRKGRRKGGARERKVDREEEDADLDDDVEREMAAERRRMRRKGKAR